MLIRHVYSSHESDEIDTCAICLFEKKVILINEEWKKKLRHVEITSLANEEQMINEIKRLTSENIQLKRKRQQEDLVIKLKQKKKKKEEEVKPCEKCGERMDISKKDFNMCLNCLYCLRWCPYCVNWYPDSDIFIHCLCGPE